MSHNWTLKLGAFLGAISVYFYVNFYLIQEKRPVQVRVVPPELPIEMALADHIPSFMEVEFSGPSELINFDTSEFRIYLENTHPSPGETKYQAKLIPDVPEGITARYDKEVFLTVDLLLERTLPIAPRIQNQLAPGFTIGYVHTNPISIRVRGPYRVIADMQRVQTQEISISGQIPSASARPFVQNLPDFVELAAGQPNVIETEIQVIPQDEDLREFTVVRGVPVRCANDISPLRVKDTERDTVDIVVSGDMRGLAANQFDARVVCPVFFDNDSKTIRPSFEIEDLPVLVRDRRDRVNVLIKRVVPSRVTLHFEKAPVIVNPEVEQGTIDHLIP